MKNNLAKTSMKSPYCFNTNPERKGKEMKNLNVLEIELNNGQTVTAFQSPGGVGITSRDLTYLLHGGSQRELEVLYAVDCTTRQRFGLNPRQVTELVKHGHMHARQKTSTPIIITLQAIEGLKSYKKYADNDLLTELAVKIREAI